MTEEKDKKAKMDWLDQHDSIQLDLLKMKEDIVRETPGSTPNDKKEHTENDRTTEKSFKDLVNDVPQKGSDNVHNNSMDLKQIEKEKRTTTSGITFGMEGEGGERKEAPKLPAGKIPTSPDLTMKIANVIQLESKLKRRKYELEKKERLSREAKEKQKEISDGINPLVEQTGKEDAAPKDMNSLVIPSPPVSPINNNSGTNPPNDQKVRDPGIGVEVTAPSTQSISESIGDPIPDNFHSNGPPPTTVRRRMIIRRKGTMNDFNGGMEKKDQKVSGQNNIEPNIDISTPSTNESRVKSGGPLKGLTKFFRRRNDGEL